MQIEDAVVLAHVEVSQVLGALAVEVEAEMLAGRLILCWYSLHILRLARFCIKLNLSNLA